jgi:hypothetical protein
MATTLAALYQFESQLETGFAALLNSVTTNIYYRRSTETKASPFLDVLVSIGPATNHERWTGSEKEENIFEATISVSVHTGRSKSGQNTAHHDLIGKVRSVILSSVSGYNSTNFPDLAVLSISSEGSSFEVDQETNLDRTILEFSFFFGIRSTAYPS